MINGHLPVVKTLARAGGVYAVDDVSDDSNWHNNATYF